MPSSAPLSSKLMREDQKQGIKAASGSSFGAQFVAVTRKSLLLRWYSKFSTIFELLLPPIFMALLVMGFYLAGGLGGFVTAQDYANPTAGVVEPGYVASQLAFCRLQNASVHPKFQSWAECRGSVTIDAMSARFDRNGDGVLSCYELASMATNARGAVNLFEVLLRLSTGTSCALTSIPGLALGVQKNSTPPTNDTLQNNGPIPTNDTMLERLLVGFEALQQDISDLTCGSQSRQSLCAPPPGPFGRARDSLSAAEDDSTKGETEAEKGALESFAQALRRVSFSLGINVEKALVDMSEAAAVTKVQRELKDSLQQLRKRRAEASQFPGGGGGGNTGGYINSSPQFVLPLDTFVMLSEIARTFLPDLSKFAVSNPTASLTRYGGLMVGGPDAPGASAAVSELFQAMNETYASWSVLTNSAADWWRVARLAQQPNSSTYMRGSLDRFPDSLWFQKPSNAVDFATNAAENAVLGVVWISELNLGNGSGHPLFKYAIRQNYSNNPQTTSSRIRSSLIRGNTTSHCLYRSSGFVSIQRALDSAFAKLLVDRASARTGVSRDAVTELLGEPGFEKVAAVLMPTGSYYTSSFLSFAGTFLPLIMVFAFLYSVSQSLGTLVTEKESGTREAAFIMGLRRGAFYLSYLVLSLVSAFIIAVLSAAILKGMLLRTDFFVMFVVIFLYALSVSSFAFFLSSLFSKSRIAAIAGPLLMFAVSIPVFALQGTEVTGFPKFLLLLLPATPFAEAMGVFCQRQATDLPASFVDLSPDNWYAIPMLIFDAVYLFVLGWYLDHVLPSAIGAQEKPWFLFLPSYWCPSADAGPGVVSSGALNTVDMTTHNHGARGRLMSAATEQRLEDLSLEQQSRVRVDLQGLTREFKTDQGVFRAVDNLSLALTEGDITVILGHNGAGKTTTVNMLTGILAPTSGDAMVFGSSIVKEMAKVRRSVGFCPQRNVLWPTLSVRQHLSFYATLKGIPSADQHEEVDEMIRRVKLLDKADTPALALSGGQKRKLSVGIALIGGSRVVFLDEPTAGMDVQARRGTWEILQAAKPGRVIVLSTHYMDEAEILGSRIAIMNRGKLHACGSSLFLKSRLGVGYNLAISMKEPEHFVGSAAASPAIGASASSVAAANAAIAQLAKKKESVIKLVNREVDDAEVVTDVGCELSLRLPMKETSKFAKLLDNLDRSCDEYGVRSYGMSVTTLEEIFIRIATEDHGHQYLNADKSQAGATDVTAVARAPELSAVVDNDIDPFAGPPSVVAVSPPAVPQAAPIASSGQRVVSATGQGSAWTQYYALLIKRLHCARRDRKTICCMIVMPVVFIALAFVFSIFGPPVQPSLELVPESLYGSGQRGEIVYTSSPIPSTSLADVSLDSYFGVYDAESRRTGKLYANVSNSSALSGLLGAERQRHGSSRRLLAVSFGDFLRSDPSLQNTPVPSCTNLTTVRSVGTLLLNSSSSHSMPLGISLLSNLILNFSLSAVSSEVTASQALPSGYMAIVSSAWPLPLGLYQQALVDSTKLIFTAIFVLIPFTFIPANFVSFIVKEREVKAKHLQLVSGVRLSAYWASTFTFDMLSFTLTVILALILFLIFSAAGLDFAKAFVDTADALFATFVLLMLYGLSVSPLVYSLSFAFEKHSTAQNVTMLTGFILGFVLVMAISILQFVESTKDIANALAWIFRVFPPYSLGEGLIKIAQRKLLLTVSQLNVSPWDWENGIGRPCIYMGVAMVVFFIVLILIEANVIARFVGLLPSRKTTKEQQAVVSNAVSSAANADDNEDADVHAERVAVEVPGGRLGDRMYVKNLTKVYAPVRAGLPAKVAVRNVSFGVRSDEIFAFLGTNGAGKTTTLSVLSGEFSPSSGTGYIDGYDVVTERDQARRNLGYCPQFDAVLDQMTAVEHLWMYGRLRGLERDAIAADVDRLVAAVGLEPHLNKPAATLSGGNKRKLSIALALIGGPAVVFLDEPSAGLDPVARRTLWDALGMLTKGCSVVLTTHHLEEVEALAQRVGIMVDGQLVCLGSLTHLKEKFGAGFELQIRCSTETKVTQATAAILFGMPGAKLVESNGLRRTFEIPRSATSLGKAFGFVELLKTKLATFPDGVSKTGVPHRILWEDSDDGEGQITDYAMGQTSLEQVFLRVSAKSIEDEADRALAADRGDDHGAVVAEVAQQSSFGSKHVSVVKSIPGGNYQGGDASFGGSSCTPGNDQGNGAAFVSYSHVEAAQDRRESVGGSTPGFFHHVPANDDGVV